MVRIVGDGEREERLSPKVALASSHPTDLPDEGEVEGLFEKLPDPGPSCPDPGVPASTEEAWRFQLHAEIPLLLVLLEEETDPHSPAEKVLFRQFDAGEPRAILHSNTQVDLGGPLVLSIHDDVLGAVRLGEGEHVRPGDERVAPEQALRLGETEEVQAVPGLEQELLLDEILSSPDMEGVGQPVCPEQGCIRRYFRGIEDRPVVDEDVGDLALWAFLGLNRPREGGEGGQEQKGPLQA